MVFNKILITDKNELMSHKKKYFNFLQVLMIALLMKICGIGLILKIQMAAQSFHFITIMRN